MHSIAMSLHYIKFGIFRSKFINSPHVVLCALEMSPPFFHSFRIEENGIIFTILSHLMSDWTTKDPVSPLSYSHSHCSSSDLDLLISITITS